MGRLQASENSFTERKKAAVKCVEENYQLGELHTEFTSRVDCTKLSADLLKQIWKEKNNVEKKKAKEKREEEKRIEEEKRKAEEEEAAALNPNIAEADLDKEMQLIVANLQKEKEMKASTDQADEGDDGEKPKEISDMTYEEKMEWLTNKRKIARKKREKEKLEKNKNTEKNRRETARAAMELQQRRNEYAQKAAISAKKKEERERKEARKKIKEKIRLQKLERKRQREIEQAHLAKMKKT